MIRRPAVSLEHGTLAAFTAGCQCIKCWEAEYSRRQVANMKQIEDIPEHWHGRPAGYVNGKCRCDRCVADHRKRSREAAAANARKPCPEDKHGTIAGYRTYHCRCDQCRQANTEQARRWREKRKNFPSGLRNHGTPSEYSNGNCRCRLCTDAWWEWQREYKDSPYWDWLAEHPSAKTHCKNGHKFGPRTARIDSRGQRTCIVCKKNRDKGRDWSKKN